MAKKAVKKTAKKATKKKAVKKTAKKAAPKEPAPEPQAESKGFPTWAAVLIAIIVLAVLGAVLYFGLQGQSELIDDDVVATVNGEPIYASSIDSQYDRLPDEIKSQFSKDEVVRQEIDKRIILQHAYEQDIVVTDVEVDQRITDLTASFGTTTEVLKELLEQANVSFDEYYEAIREEIVLNRFVEEEIVPSISVTDDDIQDYYNENIQSFSGAEGQKKISHVLVADEETAAAITNLARSGEDFAQLARDHSIGPTGPDGGDLGYVDEATPFVPEFKEVALILEVGEVSDPVESQFGWHVIKRFPDVTPLEEVRDEVEQLVRQQQSRVQFEDLLGDLKAQSTIKLFAPYEEVDLNG